MAGAATRLGPTEHVRKQDNNNNLKGFSEYCGAQDPRGRASLSATIMQVDLVRHSPCVGDAARARAPVGAIAQTRARERTRWSTAMNKREKGESL